MSCVYSASQLAILHGKKFNVGHYAQAFQPIFFISAMFICANDYHFIPFSLTLTLPGGHMVSAKQDIVASFFRTLSI